MAYDISMLAVDQVIALLNDEYPALNFNSENVELGLPVMATGAEPTRNTELTITGIPGKGLKGQKTVFYDRINFAEFAALPAGATIQVPAPFTLEGIVAAFNDHFGSQLTLDDVRDDLVMPTEPTEPGTSVAFDLIASADSYAYRGTISLQIQIPDIDLEVAITEAYLNGLTLNTPVEEPVE